MTDHVEETAGELCAGYSGLLMALRLAGWPVRLGWVSEVDADASKVLAHHHPDVPNLGDMTAVDWGKVAKVDVLAGGIPCQGWSLAGKRNGSDDERDLWPVRKLDDAGNPRRGALDAIRALRPRVFLLENVASLVSAEGGRPFAMILTDLHQLGYNAGWVTVGACRVGACHHRHRVFLIATTGEVVPPEGALFGLPLSAAAKWPTSGLMVGGQVWPLEVEVCGANVAEATLFPTPTATAYGNNQSPSAGAAVRPSLEGVVQMLPTPNARIADKRGTPSVEPARQRIESGRQNLEDAIAMLPTPRVSAERTSRQAILGSSSSPSLGQAVEIMRGELPRELESWDEAPASWLPLLPTPTASDGTAGPGHAASAQGSPDLRTVVSMLPTPTARDATRGAGRKQPEGRPLSEVIALLPTPRASDTGTPGRRASEGFRPPLSQVILGQMLPTPRASDAEKGGPNQRGSSGDVMLPSAVQPGRFGAYEQAVRRHEWAFGVAAPDPTEPGRLGKPRLSPKFPEFMQGLPPGWLTDLIGGKGDPRPNRITRNAAIKLAGNGVNPVQGALAIHLLAQHMPNLIPATVVLGVAA